ncbi:hypothetical protein ACIQYG_05975 [Peribacillus sp. NPDC096622]|uniref:hypothetical protein n=1 Tax=Peribacillus sp. NPDC096622 TaxID=3364396 RepID=UPI00381B0801
MGWKKFATLLPNNWLAETPQPLAVRRLGRQSAERERISEITGSFPFWGNTYRIPLFCDNSANISLKFMKF